MTRRRWIVLSLIVFASAGTYLFADWYRCLPAGMTANYVGGSKCAQCHPGQQRQWAPSHHAGAMALATSETVLGNFADATYEQFGVKSRMFRDGDKFMVETEGRTEGKREAFQVKYTFGVSPLQQYMVEFPDGRVQVLPLCWDVKKKEWFHIYPNEPIKPGDPLHWTGFAQTWNHMCAECHSTDVHKNYDAKTNTYHTSFSEINVSCESCHGPGSLHVQIAESKKVFWDRRYGYGLPNLKEKDEKTGRFENELAACARCHARHTVVHAGFTPGDNYLDFFSPALLNGIEYHPDGQLLDEAYEYGSFLQSHMYRKGVHCADCHDPHTSKLKAEGNDLCIRCHVAAKYDTPAHHHHLADSAGSQCVECHMPTTNYMVVHARRDHSLRIPRPDLSQKLGSQNACNNCHRHGDKTPEWAAGYVTQWFGPKRRDVPHYGEVIQAGRDGAESADAALVKLVKSPDVGPMVRASAVSLLRQGDRPESIKTIESALRDPDALVRAAAVANLPGDRATALAVPLLRDPVGLVRHEAFSSLIRNPPSQLPPNDAEAFKKCYQEFLTGLDAALDTPGANITLATFWGSQQDLEKAEYYFQHARRLDPTNVAALRGLAQLYTQQKEPKRAEENCLLAIQFGRSVIAKQDELVARLTALNKPRDVARAKQEQRLFRADLAQSLKQLAVAIHAQKDRDAEAHKHLKDALGLLPDDREIRILCGEVAQLLGRDEEAIELLKEGLASTPHEPEFAIMLADLFLRQNRSDAAASVLEKALAHHSDDTRLIGRLAHVEFGLKHWPRAAELAERWLRMDPRNAEAAQLLETALRSQGTSRP